MEPKELEPHFLQSKYWESVRMAMGQKTVRVGNALLLIKNIPLLNKKMGYMPQVNLETLDWKLLERTATDLGLIHIQLDPSDLKSNYTIPTKILSSNILIETASIYYRNTNVIDIRISKDQLFAQMKPKTRYNTNLSSKKEVVVRVEESAESLQSFINLFFETVHRQNYFGRNEEYYRTIWKTLKPLGKVKIATAYFKDQPLVSWMLFLGDNGVIYYPYGGSSLQERNRMPANGLVWGIIEWGKENGYKYLDLWGVADLDDKESESGFSKFKRGYGGVDINYFPSQDLVFVRGWYRVFKILNSFRWTLLKLKKLF